MAAKKLKLDHRHTLDGTTLSTQGMAKVLGITVRWLSEKTKDGTIPSLGRGRYDPMTAVVAYIDFVKVGVEKKVGSESLDNLRDMKAQELRLNMARKDRLVIALDEALAVTEEMSGIFVTSLQGLPAQISGVPRERQRLDGIFDKERQRVADRLAERVAALRAGTSHIDPSAEDDAS
jgi:hypothetical protein